MFQLRVWAKIVPRLPDSCAQSRWASLAPSALRQQQMQDIKDLQDYFPTLVDELKEESRVCNLPSETEWVGKMLHHVSLGGKCCRILVAYNSMRALALPGTLDEKYLTKCKRIGWSMELIQASLLMADDIVDRAPQRRGKQSWVAVAGLGAVSDALLAEQCAYRVLAKTLPGDEYSQAMRIVTHVLFKFAFGQNHDQHCLGTGQAKFEDYNLQRHRALCDYKSGEYTFYMPTAVPLVLHGYCNKATHNAATELSSDIGYIYQVQDDYLDCYGQTEKMGKKRTDILNGKCTWLIAEAKRRANKEQLQILKKNYGSEDQEKIDAVVDIYNELHLNEVFLEYQRRTFEEIEVKIKKYYKVVNPGLFTYALETIKHHVGVFC